jgi:hypothetical protein
MSIKTKTAFGYLRDIKGKEIITEVSVHISLISPPDLNGQPRIKGTLIIQSFKPEYHDKQYILELNEKIMGRVRITMQPMASGDMDLITTQYDIWFEDSFWASGIEWFESL